MSYLALKGVHQWLVGLSIGGFVLRALAMAAGVSWVRGRAARTLPHLLDTLLLLSGVWLAWTLRLSPGNAPWLMAKLAGLVAYVVIGALALRARSPGRRLAALAAALLIVGWMVSVAITKNPWGWLNALA